MSITITGTADQISELLAGPRQHASHMQAWRWHQLTKDNDARHQAVMAAMRKLLDEYHGRVSWNAQ